MAKQKRAIHFREISDPSIYCNKLYYYPEELEYSDQWDVVTCSYCIRKKENMKFYGTTYKYQHHGTRNYHYKKKEKKDAI